MTEESRTAWTEPGAHEVAAGVFRLPLPLPHDGLRAVNVYAVVGPDGGVALIDGGWAIEVARDRLERSLAEIDVGLEQVTDILVTHAHRDHYTLAVTIRREFGSRITLGAAERVNAEALASLPAYPDLPQTPILVRAGAPHVGDSFRQREKPFDNADWELPDRWVEHESTVQVAGRTLRVLLTPGHTRGHVVYLDQAAGLMFAGDHVLPQITPSLGFEQAPPPNPLTDFLASLQLLRARPDARVLPGHGPVTDSVHARVDELVEHHARRLDATLAAVAGGAASAHEVAGVLRWTRRRHRLGDLDDLNQMLAIVETVAHLDLLVGTRRLSVAESHDGVARYRI